VRGTCVVRRIPRASAAPLIFHSRKAALGVPYGTAYRAIFQRGASRERRFCARRDRWSRSWCVCSLLALRG
jgi:hypothetical protein